ncbi:phosphatase PAP2 family protein [Limosilactobacillus agrestimuris]|uniref:phosphatase PAP2 family protein n=1 Tax=Limosilactobacillus agrestimuris TaxID=2941331 RepID=UPI0020418AF1|nr:phosphatase PAP2 family protein [Limosilactobacillus agrestimuris]
MKAHQNYQQFYQQITKPFSHSPLLIRGLCWLNKAIVVLMYVSYICLLLWVALFDGGIYQLLPLVFIPGAGFLLLSLIRSYLNYPRPYEEWPIKPLIPRKGSGDSLPSRHVFSATVIALSVMSVSKVLGIILLLLAIALAVVRVIGGIHYPRDVIAGFLCGVACGIGVLLIP